MPRASSPCVRSSNSWKARSMSAATGTWITSIHSLAAHLRCTWNMPVGWLQTASPVQRWLAANGIARAKITGNITASNQSLSVSGSSYIGTVKLTTDADLIRIPKSAGTITGNSGGADSSYYYVKSGDTIKITSTQSKFSVSMQSLSSSDEEANFLVGVPSVSIQKILVPLYGAPTPLKSGSVTFELKLGEITVTKKSDDGILLKGTVFELLNSAGSVIATATTNAKGVATFASLQPGNYTVREKTASQGYKLSSASQNVAVVAGVTSTATFTNARISRHLHQCPDLGPHPDCQNRQADGKAAAGCCVHRYKTIWPGIG